MGEHMPFWQSDSTASSGRFIIRPNRSITKKGINLLLLGISIVTIGIAIRFWLIGAWMVLYFAILEMCMLGIAFVVVERKTRYCETIELNDETVLVTQENWRSTREWKYPTYWVKVVLDVDTSGWYPSHLYLSSHGKSLEIGSCLNEEERLALTQSLRKRIEGYRM